MYNDVLCLHTVWCMAARSYQPANLLSTARTGESCEKCEQLQIYSLLVVAVMDVMYMNILLDVLLANIIDCKSCRVITETYHGRVSTVI